MISISADSEEFSNLTSEGEIQALGLLHEHTQKISELLIGIGYEIQKMYGNINGDLLGIILAARMKTPQ
ncbi:hypothetical protein AGMMS50212_13000 [Spirochaetia bacterium]|nr:hypothetical protein AGMMS50212_13000 [Spirochaetia bacterium]